LECSIATSNLIFVRSQSLFCALAHLSGQRPVLLGLEAEKILKLVPTVNRPAVGRSG